MKENRFTELISGLTDKEFKRLGEFLKSPFFNKSPLVISLYNYLRKFYPSFEKLEIDKLSNALYGKKNEHSKTLSLIAELSRLIETFIAQLSIEEDEYYLKINTLKSFSERNLAKNFSALQKKIPLNLPDEFNRDENYYNNTITFELCKFFYRLERDEEKLPEDIESISSDIDYYFILTKLNVLHFLYYYKKSSFMNEAYLNFAKEIIEFINKNFKIIKKSHPVIYLKFLVLMSISKPDNDEYYFELKSFVFLNLDKLSLDNAEYFISALLNYATEKCNNGSAEFKKERFEIFRLSERNFIFKKLRFVNHIDFQNAISASIAVNNIKFAENFLFEYKSKLIPEFKADTIEVGKAQIFFAQKKYDEALNSLIKVDYLNSAFYLRSKVLQSKIYYMQKEHNSQYYLIDSVKHYLKRNKEKMTKTDYELYWKYFSFIKKMISETYNTKSKLRDLRYDIENETNVAAKEWLLQNLPE